MYGQFWLRNMYEIAAFCRHWPVHTNTGKHNIPEGSVSGSGTGPGDPGSRGPALPDPETFPYEWLGVRQYISMSCVSCL